MKNYRDFTLLILIIFSLTLLCFWNILPGEFVADDEHTIVQQNLIKSLAFIPNLFTTSLWNTSFSQQLGLYRPLTALTYAFNYALGDLNPFGYHLFNLILHSLNSAIIYWLTYRYTKLHLLALFTSILFTIHPVHTEAISNISGRPELLTAFFFLLAWSFYCLSKENSRYYFLSLFCYFCSMLAKESGITLLGVLFLSDLCENFSNFSSQIKQLYTKYFGYLVVILIYLSARVAVLKDIGVGKTWLFWRDIAFSSRIYTTSTAFIKYFQLLIWPVDLVGDYDFSQIPQITTLNATAIVASSIIIAIFLIGCFSLKRNKLIAFAILFFFITISVVSNIIVPIGVFIAERLLYLPSISVCLLAALALHWLYNKNAALKYFSLALLLAIISVSAIKIHNRNIDWLSNANYINSIVRVAPNNMKGLCAKASMDLGEKNFLAAEQKAKQAIELFPKKATPKGLLAHIYYLQGRYDEALPLLKTAISLFPSNDPTQAYLYVDLARIYNSRKEHKLAIDAFSQAINLSVIPDAYLHQELAVVYFQSGNLLEAQNQLEKALTIKPQFAEAQYNLGIVLSSLNKPQEAIERFRFAVEAEPTNVTAHNLYGKALLGQGQFQLAADEFFQAIKHASPQETLLAEIHSNLGVAYVQLGRYNDAKQEFEESLKINPNYNGAKINLEKLNNLLSKN